MDVSSLYPNIDHAEGISACEETLSNRKSPSIPTSVISNLLKLILQCNTLKFGKRFFHQIKGTAMGTPMACNYANVFMGKFEQLMLRDYEISFNRKPSVWLRYIDDIFFIWNGDETSLKHFIQFCNSYASNNHMKSTIKFTTNYSQTHITFLDTKVKFNNGKLVTELYAKPSASFQYLHRTSYHPPHTFRAITKSQFIRIRRICTTQEDYWAHATKFISFFKSRGFNESTLNKTAEEIANNPRSNFLHHNRNSLTQELKQSRKSERIPFITNWTHKLSGFQRILQYHYNEMVNEFPNLKCVFPEPPILSYRRNHNLRNLLVRSRFTPPSSNRSTSNSSPCLSKRGKGCKLCHSMSNTNFITNIQSGKTCFTSGGRSNTSDTIYAAECTKHKLIYVGHSSQKLSSRFNGHRSDINVKPKSCELAQHFHGNEECSINRDLKVYILQDNVTGPRDRREYFEDRWITRLDTKAPHGMNTNLKHFAKIHYELFD